MLDRFGDLLASEVLPGCGPTLLSSNPFSPSSFGFRIGPACEENED